MNNSVYDGMLLVGTVLNGCYEITEQVGRYHIGWEYRAKIGGASCRERV